MFMKELSADKILEIVPAIHFRKGLPFHVPTKYRNVKPKKLKI
jgi:hypothetical protein